MNPEQEFMKLLDLLARVVEANIGTLTGTDDRFIGAENLANKFFDHAASILYLSRGIKLELPSFPNAPPKFLDPASINVLVRAALETFLTFHYIFVKPTTHGEQSCRYWAWKAAGLIERQGLPQYTEKHRQKLAEEKTEIDYLHSKLRSNSAFKRLDKKQQKDILKGKWKLPHWSEIAESASFDKTWFSHEYKYLSGYTHSGSLSTIQLKQSVINREQLILVEPATALITIVIANFIRGYCQLFPIAKAALTADAEGRKMVKGLIKFGKELCFEDNNL